ncbi:hypothetical protein D3C87_04430 [compost metagenome]
MKYFLILCFLVFCGQIAAQDTLFTPNQIGRPEYTRLVSSDRIYPVVKDVNESYFELLPSDYYHVNYRYDTIRIGLKKDQDGLKLTCLNCIYMQIGLRDSSVFYIESGDARIEFDWQLIKTPKGGSGPPLKEKQKLDEAFGYVKMRNRTIFCTQIQETPPIFLAFIDRNFNGRIDSMDYVSLSESTYFLTGINSRVNFVKEVDTIATDWWNATFRLLDDKGRFVLHKIDDPVYNPSILFSNSIRNFQLDSLIDLGSFLKQSSQKYTVVTFWNEYCSSCLPELDSLERLKNQFQILTFYDRDDLENQMKKGGWTFNTYLSSRIAGESFQLNGMPYYWVLDKQRKCLLKSRYWTELKEFLTNSIDSE